MVMTQTTDDSNNTMKEQQTGTVEKQEMNDVEMQTSESSETIQPTEPISSPPSIEEQRRIIKQFEQYPLKEGEKWYLIDHKWFDAWKRHVGYEDITEPTTPQAPHPGPIENQSLIESYNSQSKVIKLQKHIIEHKDYNLVHENAGELLFKWYGGGPKIVRNVVTQNNTEIVEIHPHIIHIGLLKGNEAVQFEEMEFSKTCTLKDIMTKAKEHFNLNEDIRLWAAYYGSPYKMYSEEVLDKELEEIITRHTGQQIIVETKQDGEYPLDYKHKQKATTRFKTEANNELSSRFSYTFPTQGDNAGGEPGVCGLQNLGNTCFMNSALQCLTKTPEIYEYFISGKYKEEINVDNPLGMQGRIATAFGNLMHEMWSGRHSYISPREFKYTIGKFASQFSGYAQHDSQELIAYLLDGIHEDLNRIKNKPITNAVEHNGRDDEEVAEEAWRVHKLRNDSIIVDKFQGQLKSTVVCPECENISITFDPFMYLSLPVPVEKNRFINITVFRANNTQPPIKYCVKVPKEGFAKELRTALSEISGIKPEDLMIADIFHHKVYRFISDSMKMNSIAESDVIYAYEVPGLQPEIHENYDALSTTPFISVKLTTTQKTESYYYGTRMQETAIGIPFVLPFNEGKTTKKDLYDQCLQFVRRYLKDNISELNIDLDDPTSIFPVKKTPTQSTQAVGGEVAPPTVAEDETLPDATEEEEKDKSVEEVKKDEKKFHLFTLKLSENEYSYYNYSDDGEELDYSDEPLVVKKPNSKMTLLMHIPPNVLTELVDESKFKQSIEHESIHAEKDLSENGVSVEDCLKLFTSTEKLGKEDAWYCPKCKKFVEATKKFDLWSLPEVLVVHLKRFHYNRYLRDKIETNITFPLDNFDLTPYVLGPQRKLGDVKYELYAVSNHYGGLGGGHYTASAKVNGTWYKFDDSHTSRISPNDVRGPAAYVLFYHLKRPKQNNIQITEENNDDKMETE